MLFASQPMRNLTVTGTGTAFLTASTMRAARSGDFMSAEPSPLFAILGAGQPMLISMISQPEISSARCALRAMQSGSEPKIWAEAGCSPGARRSSLGVFLSPNSIAFALTISVTVSPAPCSRQIWRNARSVTPAIGAKIKRFGRFTLPIQNTVRPPCRFLIPSYCSTQGRIMQTFSGLQFKNSGIFDVFWQFCEVLLRESGGNLRW